MPAEDNAPPSTQERLSTLGRVMGELVHDLNNEVMALHGWATLARGELEVGRLPSTEVDRVIGITDGMAQMLRDVLDTVAGRTLSPEVTFDPLVLTEKTISDRLRGLSSVTLRLHSSLPGGTRIRGRSSFWVRILANLLANATRHAHSEVFLSLTLETTERGAQVVVLRVEDDGAGVSASDKDFIFDPLWRGESGEIGFGLSSVQWAVSQLQGAITYRDTPLGGAAFEVTMPIASRLVNRPDKERSPGNGAETLSGLRFVVLTHEPAAGDALRQLVHPCRVEAHVLAFGDEPETSLLQSIRLIRPDVILVDLRGEPWHALDLWSQLRAEMPELAVRAILLGGESVAEPHRRHALQTGQPLLTEPFDARDLARTVSRLPSQA